MSYLDGHNWLDGPKFAAWFEGELRRQGYTRVSDSLARRLYGWRRGERANVYTADRHLIEYGLHPASVPDECWIDGGRPCECGCGADIDKLDRKPGARFAYTSCAKRLQRKRRQERAMAA